MRVKIVIQRYSHPAVAAFAVSYSLQVLILVLLGSYVVLKTVQWLQAKRVSFWHRTELSDFAHHLCHLTLNRNLSIVYRYTFLHPESRNGQTIRCRRSTRRESARR